PPSHTLSLHAALPIFTPIAQEVLDPALAAELEFHPWFINVLMHELAHGLGPGFITTESGARITVNQALKEHYSAIEEAKADVTGDRKSTRLNSSHVKI